MENCFLTIIVPVYNVEDYLRQCLDSLLNQTITAHKVIIVNDGSTDSSGVIAEKYAKRYPELFEYIYQQNRGLGAARNTGLKHVNTPYVGFLDSDDWLMPTYVERIEKRLSEESETPDIIFTTPHIYDMANKKTSTWMDNDIFNEVFITENTAITPRASYKIYALEASVCRRVFSVAFLRKNSFSFPEGTKWEDVEPHFSLLHEANRCIGIPTVGFMYRINSGNQITASTGTGRLQVVSVFSRCLSKAIEESWESIEISYILRMMNSFVKWSIDCSLVSVRKDLIKAVHGLYKAIPKKVLKDYYEDMHVFKNDRLLVWLLRSRFYFLTCDAQYYALLRGAMNRFILHKKGR